MALGEIRLEEGNFSAARWCWERILPVRVAAGRINTWPGYPDSALDPAAVRRLVLASILEGSTEHARSVSSLRAIARRRAGKARRDKTVRYSEGVYRICSNQSRLSPQKPSKRRLADVCRVARSETRLRRTSYRRGERSNGGRNLLGE